MIIIIVIFVLIWLYFTNLEEKFLTKPSSYYQDLYKSTLHSYPFDFYTLYGYDDYYPMYTYNWELPQRSEMHRPEHYQKEWIKTKARRRDGIKYHNQLPSFNYVRQLFSLESSKK